MVFEILFRKLNGFYEKVFFNYGLFVSKYPIHVIVFSVLLNLILSIGVFKMNMIKDADELFMTSNSDARKSEKYFKYLFNNTNTVNQEFYAHQLFDLGTGAEINFRVRGDPNANILENKYLSEILSVHRSILENVIVQINNETIKFENVCATRNGKCWIEGADLLQNSDDFFEFLKEKFLNLRKNETDRLSLQLEDTIYTSKNGISFLGLIFGKDFQFVQNEKNPETYAYARIFKIRYQMKYSVPSSNINSKLWENEFLKYAKTMNTTLITFTYSTSGSLEKEIEANIGFDTKLIATTFILIMVFAIIFMSLGSNIITSPGILLPSVGIFSAFFGVTSSYGLLSFLGYPSCSLIAIIPFLVLGNLMMLRFDYKFSISFFFAIFKE